MKVSNQGLQLIKTFEGLRFRPYKDAAGKETIGYGHLIKPGEHFTAITQAEATQLLIKDVEVAERAINELVKVPLTQNQFDALASFIYNVGVENFRKSTLLRKLNAGDYVGAMYEFQKWVYAGGKKLKGLERRRETEAQLFALGLKHPQPSQTS
jgi:lysozyme